MLINVFFADKNSSRTNFHTIEATTQEEYDAGMMETMDDVRTEFRKFDFTVETDGDEELLKEWEDNR